MQRDAVPWRRRRRQFFIEGEKRNANSQARIRYDFPE